MAEKQLHELSDQEIAVKFCELAEELGRRGTKACENALDGVRFRAEGEEGRELSADADEFMTQLYQYAEDYSE